MQTLKAVYENGRLLFPEGTAPEGRMEVVVIFPEQAERSPADAAEPRDKDAGKRFVQECAGVLRGHDIGAGLWIP